jgi:8-oxo-dGTP pyrophosphatase MutT (NUDIX family)
MTESPADAPEKPIKDASTVILLRENGGALETFMLCRHSQSGFMGGAHVFPGGKVDVDDTNATWEERVDRSSREMADLLGEADQDDALGFWVAGIRETLEEAGVLVANTEGMVELEAARQRLGVGIPFSQIAAEIGMTINAMALTPYARWITPKMETKRFDTRFFVAVLPEGQRATHDGTETTSAIWLKPSEALEGMHAGRIKLAPPTVRTLEWLAAFETAASAIADASSRKPPLVRPRIVAGESGWFLALPGDPKHPEDNAVLPGSTRMVLEGGAWVDSEVPVG